MKLPQIITDLKGTETWDWITEPDGRLHPNTERALLDGFYFDVETAQWIQDFCTSLMTLPRSAGELITDYEVQSIRRTRPDFDPEKPSSTKPFAMLRMWHRQIVGQLYGWKHPNGKRRFKKAFITTAKKSAKTTTLSVLPLAEMFRSSRPEKELYVVASTQSQAEILFKKTFAILKRCDELKSKVRCMYASLRLMHDPTNSFFAALPNDENSIQGIEPDLLILDELHAWYGRKVYDALVYGDIRREESLRVVISTAGDDEQNVCHEEYEVAKDLLDPNSATYAAEQFAFIAEAGKDPVTMEYRDERWDESTWWTEQAAIDANPTLLDNPVALLNTMAEAEAAKNTPARKRSYVRYINNRWVGYVAEAWLNRSLWRECEHALPHHRGESVCLGLDLAQREDLVALALAWQGPGDKIDLRCRLYMPEHGIDEKAHAWRAPLHQWIEDGWITVLPGRSIPIDHLRYEISGVGLNADGSICKQRNENAIAEQFVIKELAFDRALAQTLVYQWLAETDGIECTEHGMGFRDMSPATKEFAHLIGSRRIRHDGNPVLDWMVGHCIVTMDPAGNIKPDKKQSRQKIDGLVAAIMAVSRVLNGKPKAKSVYAYRGVLTG